MLKNLVIGLLITSSLLAENEILKFLKYSTAYASFSLNAPRFQDDRFAIVGGLSTGDLVVERTNRDLKPDFQTSFGLRKIGRFQYEPKRGVKSAGKGGTWYDGTESNYNESATFGPVKGWEYLLKFSEGRQWGNEYINQEYWVRYIGDWAMAKVGWTELGLEDISYVVEIGDIIDWNSGYWEISSINESQFVGGQTDYNHSVVCNSFLVRMSHLNIERVRSV